MKIASMRRVLTCSICSSLMWAAPLEARFLQVDPVGYKDQFNLYAYVGDDPLNATDPTGTDTIVLIRENGNVDIVLPMTFTGDAATPGNIASAMQNIQANWTGNFEGTHVTTTVVQGTSSLDPSVRNQMRITSGNTSLMDPSNGHQGHSFVRGGNTAEVTMRDVGGQGIRQPNGTDTRSDKGQNTPAHEGGHLMGAPDRSTSDSLMGHGSSNRVTAQDIQDITRTSPPAGGVNTVIRCAHDERC